MESSAAVTLIVITRNHERYIDQALASVSAQTLRDFEVIVVDDASTDGTPDRIRAWLDRPRHFDVRLITNPTNIGICASRNNVLRICRGRFIAALSGDDYYEPSKLERQLAHFGSMDASVAAIFGRARVVDACGRELGLWFEFAGDVPEGRIFDRLLRGNFLSAPTVMVRRSAIDAVGGYDESLFFEDYDMWLRLSDRFEFRYFPDVLVNYRIHDQGTSRSARFRGLMNESRVRLLLKWLDRDRTSRVVASAGAWKFALSAFAADPVLGRDAMRRVCDAAPTFLRRVLSRAATLPGSHAVAAAAFAVVVWWREWRRYTWSGRMIVP